MSVRVLSLCCVFPTGDEPGRGVFVRARLAALARGAEVRVLAPVGIIRWGAGKGRRTGAPRPGQEGGLDVTYARWLYPPNAGWQNGLLLFLQLLPAAMRLRREGKWDVLDAHFAHPEGVAAALLALCFGGPFTVTMRGNELEQIRSGWRRRLAGWALRRSARVFAVSRELRDLAVELGVSPERALLSPNGVDTAVFAPGEQAAARRRLGFPDGDRLFLSAGKMDAGKGILELIDAVAPLLAGGARLAIAGGAGRTGTSYADEVRRRCARTDVAGRITLLGEVRQTELAEWMRAADVFCLNSRREGCPNVVIEALACGLPVVATRVGAVPELLPSEEFGLIVPPRDPAALREALGRAVATRWDRPAIAVWGRSRSWDRVAGELLAEFGKIEAGATWTSR